MIVRGQERDDRAPAADVLLAEAVPPEAEAEIQRLFGDLGMTVRTRSVPAQRGLSDVTWLVLATLPLEAFVKALVGDLTEDAYGRLKVLLARLRRHGAARSEEDPRPMVLQDPVSRLRVVLEPDLPMAAYKQLIKLDLSRFRQGPLHYDQQRSRWRSELDESTRRRR